MEQLTGRWATEEDLALLSALRGEVLRAANLFPPDKDMSGAVERARDYYRTALAEGRHMVWLMLDGGTVAGVGDVCFYTVMPSWDNPTGRKAYIMNMYTAPAYRRRGIGAATLDRLVCAAREQGVDRIALEATDMGRKLYTYYGFVAAESEMYLPSVQFSQKKEK